MLHQITARNVEEYEAYLRLEEKSPVTIQKYIRDLQAFRKFSPEGVEKQRVLAFKAYLLDQGYRVSSINSMLAALNSFFAWQGWADCRVRHIRVQRRTYCASSRELSREEYFRLLEAARGEPRLQLVLETICATGIRVSELRYVTAESLSQGQVCVRCKSKLRTIFLPAKLRRKLQSYVRAKGIRRGPVFVSSRGNPLDRSYLWAKMKGLCSAAGVAAEKVFPHNLRKLFARSFYALEKDIAKLADILGHSHIETTRIYIMSTGQEHRQQLSRLQLLL